MPKPYFRADNFSCHQSLGYLTRRVQNLTNPHAEAIFADRDLTFTQWISLMGLREGVAETSADLARHLNHDAGAVTRVVDELEKRGLVRRERSKSDRRVVNLTLTPQGRAVAKQYVPPIVDFWNTVMDEFSNKEISQLIELLSRLIHRLEAEPLAEPARKRAAR
ncbi:MAG: MarR family winged helix-turn-helix transcriptional regulator [Rhizomicrobium sp.]